MRLHLPVLLPVVDHQEEDEEHLPERVFHWPPSSVLLRIPVSCSLPVPWFFRLLNDLLRHVEEHPLFIPGHSRRPRTVPCSFFRFTSKAEPETRIEERGRQRCLTIESSQIWD